jgi:hypothetical protein
MKDADSIMALVGQVDEIEDVLKSLAVPAAPAPEVKAPEPQPEPAAAAAAAPSDFVRALVDAFTAFIRAVPALEAPLAAALQKAEPQLVNNELAKKLEAGGSAAIEGGEFKALTGLVMRVTQEVSNGNLPDTDAFAAEIVAALTPPAGPGDAGNTPPDDGGNGGAGDGGDGGAGDAAAGEPGPQASTALGQAILNKYDFSRPIMLAYNRAPKPIKDAFSNFIGSIVSSIDQAAAADAAVAADLEKAAGTDLRKLLAEANVQKQMIDAVTRGLDSNYQYPNPEEIAAKIVRAAAVEAAAPETVDVIEQAAALLANIGQQSATRMPIALKVAMQENPGVMKYAALALLRLEGVSVTASLLANKTDEAYGDPEIRDADKFVQAIRGAFADRGSALTEELDEISMNVARNEAAADTAMETLGKALVTYFKIIAATRNHPQPEQQPPPPTQAAFRDNLRRSFTAFGIKAKPGDLFQ